MVRWYCNTVNDRIKESKTTTHLTTTTQQIEIFSTFACSGCCFIRLRRHSASCRVKTLHGGPTECKYRRRLCQQLGTHFRANLDVYTHKYGKARFGVPAVALIKIRCSWHTTLC